MESLHRSGPARPSHASSSRPRFGRIGAGGARGGQSVLEFALVAPLLVLFLLAVFSFGLLYQSKVALDNAVRDATRFASEYPDYWDTGASPNPRSIQGRLIYSGGLPTIANSSSNISIVYSATTISGSSVSFAQCGSYTSSYNATVGTEATCLVPGSLVTVTAKISYQIPVPIVSNIIKIISPSGLPLQSSASMLLNVACTYC